MQRHLRRISILIAVLGLTAAALLTGSPLRLAGASTSSHSPHRLLDTRVGLGGTQGPVSPGQVVRLDIPAARAAGATSVVINLTATEASAPGWVRAFPCDSPQPTTSSLNYVRNENIANAAVIRLGDGGICFSTYSTVQLVVDLSGWFTGSDDFVGVSPVRLLDTRATGNHLVAGVEQRLQIAGGPGADAAATIAALNFTVDNPARPGWLVAYPCGQPTSSSTVNFSAGDTVANMSFVGLGDGAVCLRSMVDVNVVVDSYGWSTGQGSLRAQSPQRLLDTREPSWPAGRLANGGRIALRVAGRGGIPNTAAAALLTVTVTNTSGAGHVTAWPCDRDEPDASTLNMASGRPRSNMALVALAADGTGCFQLFTSNNSPIDLVVDAVGYATGGPARSKPNGPGTATGRSVPQVGAGQVPQQPGPGPSAPPVGAGAVAAGPGVVASLIPPSSASEPTGSFRFICNFSHLSYDDPIVDPGQPGASHLHMFFGNTATDASSTYDSLRSSGGGSCAGGTLNRSGYWAPAMFNQSGQVVIPDYITVYYKGNGPSADQIRQIRPFPAGLRMIAGYNMASPGGDTHFAWDCENGGSNSQTIPSCPAGQRVGVRLIFPTCWDGANLDSADHRSHMAYGTYGTTGKWHCPDGYPVLLPEYQIGIWYSNDGATSSWHLSSDQMTGMTHPNGSTLHADWFGAWDPATMQTWVSTCIDGLLNCTSGELGNGTSLSGPPAYTGPKVVAAPTR